MEILKTNECFVAGDELFDFDIQGEGEDEEEHASFKGDSASSSSMEYPVAAFSRGSLAGPFPEFEEELEWLSNKDAFPAVETCFGILADNLELIKKHHSPVSVLENSTSSSNGSTVASCCDSFKVPTSHPVRARTKMIRRRRVVFGDLSSQQCYQVNVKNKQESSPLPLQPITNSGASMGRRCLHCQTDKTPQWRAGPMGPKTLCNACGVRYKSGRLLPEYRPASSPTFSSVLHSNSHRKVVEMRRQKQLTTGEGIAAAAGNVSCGYRVG